MVTVQKQSIRPTPVLSLFPQRNYDVHLPCSIPKRSSRTQKDKESLYKRQRGLCNGCEGWFPLERFQVDHVVAASKGGTDDLSNWQLLCRSCNSRKGDRTMKYLMDRLMKLVGVLDNHNQPTLTFHWGV